MPRKNNIILFVLLALSLLDCGKVSAQISISSSTGTDPALNTYSQVVNGATASQYLTLQYSLNGSHYAAGWTVQVKANGDFINGSASIPSQDVSLKFNTVLNKKGTTGVTGSQVALTGTNATLLSSSQSLSGYYMAQNFDLIVQGSSQFLSLPTGTYRTTLTVTLQDNVGNVLATNSSIAVSFSIGFNNSCSGVSLAASFSNGYTFSTYAETESGGTAPQAITIGYSPNAANCIGWSLAVQANGNFTNGANSISPNNVSLRFNQVTSGSPSASAIGVSSTPVALSTSNVYLITNSNAPFVANTYTAQTYDMIVQGGAYLAAVPMGTYSCPLTFSVYNSSGQLVATANCTASFTISYNNSFSYSITVNDPTVNFQYNSESAYLNGVTVSQPNGVSINASSAYQVIAKTTAASLANGSNTIPVSVIRFSNTAPVANPNITSTAVNLSTSDQVIITNPMTDYTYQNISYNLQYSIAGGNTTISTAPSGAYTTTLVFVVLPG